MPGAISWLSGGGSFWSADCSDHRAAMVPKTANLWLSWNAFCNWLRHPPPSSVFPLCTLIRGECREVKNREKDVRRCGRAGCEGRMSTTDYLRRIDIVSSFTVRALLLCSTSRRRLERVGCEHGKGWRRMDKVG